MYYHYCYKWGGILSTKGNDSSLGRILSFNSFCMQSRQSGLSSSLSEGLLPSFDEHSPTLCIKVIQRNPSEEKYSHMENKATGNVRVLQKIRKQMYKCVKLKPRVHMAHYGRCFVFFGQDCAFHSCKLSGRQYCNRKLSRAKTWLIRSQS